MRGHAVRERGSLVKGSNNEICSGAYKESRKGGGGIKGGVDEYGEAKTFNKC